MTRDEVTIGIDLGGTKSEARVLDSAGNEVIAPIRVASPRDNYAATLEMIVDLVRQAEAACDAPASPRFGVAIPGAICPVRDVVKNANSTWLNGQALHRDLAERTGRPLRVENDANCFALSEARDGAGVGADSLFGVILGTGTGGGLVLGGSVVSGANRTAGEWGHMQLPLAASPDGRPCYCGSQDCVETHLCGPAFEADYARRTGQRLRATEIAAASVSDPIAHDTFDLWLTKLAASMSVVVNVFDPSVIVLGGGLSNIVGLSEHLAERLPKFVFGTTGASLATRIVRNRHGDSSGARGAAWIASDV